MERPILFSTDMVKAILAGNKTQTRRIVKGTALEWLAPDMFVPEFVADPDNELCPYGETGDVLWVRETWDFGYPYFYKANGDLPSGKWKPSIHMPKAAARIWLQIEEVRIERLQDITEEDAKAEGVERWIEDRLKSKPTRYKVYCDLIDPKDPALYSSLAYHSFETLWHKLNGLESWNANPWVWVIKFNVLSTTGKPKL